MAKIERLYVINHTHTDIGFTDYQEVVYRQHRDFINAALDLIEETDDYPEGAKAKWVCEVTGMTEHYLRHASSRQIERFLKWHRAGRLDVAGIQYNLTPLLNIEQMHRTLYPLRRLRDDYGIRTQVAMNCDVNGVSWLFADLLPRVGIDLLTMAINTIRGRAPQPRPAAFWWLGPAGGRMLAWNGYHYTFGGLLELGGRMGVAAERVSKLVKRLEEDTSYPFDFVYGQATHPLRPDNGPPDHRLPQFVRRWNEQARSPRIEIITLSEFRGILRDAVSNLTSVPTWRGDWVDWWSDGVASSAYETGMNRATHELLHVAEMLGAWIAARGSQDPVEDWIDAIKQVYHSATLYDEHTWGAYSSILLPQSFFSRSQWEQKAHYAYSAAANGHDLLSRAARRFAAQLAEPDEGVPHLADDRPPAAATELLVINTLPWNRRVVVDEPIRKGGQAPSGILEMFLPHNLDWREVASGTDARRVEGTVPGCGYAFLPLSQAPGTDDLKAAGHTIENQFYRVLIDPKTGGLLEWYDKELGHDFAGEYQGFRIGQYVYEWLESERGRDVLFHIDLNEEDFGSWGTAIPFRRATASKVVVDPAQVKPGTASVTVRIEAPGVRGARCAFTLPSKCRQLYVEWVLDKEHATDANVYPNDVEAVFIAFPFNLAFPQFRFDLNGVPVSPDRDQLPGTARDWYSVGRWIDVSDGNRGVTLVPKDAPLVQLGGITTYKLAPQLEPEGPTLMSWALNNHWMVNFKASQGGEIPLRYALTTHAGPCDDGAAARFGAESVTPPIVLRDYCRRDGSESRGQLLQLEGEGPGDPPVLLTAKRADVGEGVIFRLQNLSDRPTVATLRFTALKPKGASLVSPVEDEVAPLALSGDAVRCALQPRDVCSVRVAFGSV